MYEASVRPLHWPHYLGSEIKEPARMPLRVLRVLRSGSSGGTSGDAA